MKIEIDSGTFEKVIADGLKSISPEEFGAIIKQVVYEAFTKCDDLKNMLVYTRSPRWGGPEEKVLGPLAEKAMGSIKEDMDRELAPIRAKMVQCLMENHQRLIEDMMMRMLAERMADSAEFQASMRLAAQRVLAEQANLR